MSGGVTSAERHEVRLLDSLQCEPVTRAVGVRAGEVVRRYYRSHFAISGADYLIAPTALVTGDELATLDVRHFSMFPRLAPPFAI